MPNLYWKCVGKVGLKEGGNRKCVGIGKICVRFGISSCEDSSFLPSFPPCLLLSHLLESPSHIPRHISRISSPYIFVFHLICSPTLSSPPYTSLDILLYADFHFLAGIYLRKQQIFEFHLEDKTRANLLCFDFRCDDVAVQPPPPHLFLPTFYFRIQEFRLPSL